MWLKTAQNCSKQPFNTSSGSSFVDLVPSLCWAAACSSLRATLLVTFRCDLVQMGSWHQLSRTATPPTSGCNAYWRRFSAGEQPAGEKHVKTERPLVEIRKTEVVLFLLWSNMGRRRFCRLSVVLNLPLVPLTLLRIWFENQKMVEFRPFLIFNKFNEKWPEMTKFRWICKPSDFQNWLNLDHFWSSTNFQN